MILTEFLLARIAEDQADAHHASEADRSEVWEWDGSPIGGVGGDTSAPSCDLYADVGAHVARWDPARVLAECEAKRRIVEMHDGAVSALSMITTADDGSEDAVIAQGLVKSCIATTDGVLKLHAQVYAYHPDYDERWRP